MRISDWSSDVCSSDLSTVTFATLAPHFRVQGTSLFSLMRNIGSSIGISLMIYFLSYNGQILHAELGAHITPFNDLLRQPGIASIWNMATAGDRKSTRLNSSH